MNEDRLNNVILLLVPCTLVPCTTWFRRQNIRFWYKITILGKQYRHANNFRNFPQGNIELLSTAISVNSGYTSKIVTVQETHNSNAVNRRSQVGNKSECALLLFVLDLGVEYDLIRQRIPEENLHKVYTFNSIRKWMSSVVKLDDGRYRLFAKGASEVLLHRYVRLHYELLG